MTGKAGVVRKMRSYRYWLALAGVAIVAALSLDTVGAPPVLPLVLGVAGIVSLAVARHGRANTASKRPSAHLPRLTAILIEFRMFFYAALVTLMVIAIATGRVVAATVAVGFLLAAAVVWIRTNRESGRSE
jgi:hypothetical protein